MLPTLFLGPMIQTIKNISKLEIIDEKLLAECHQEALERLEPCEGKLSRTVLRGVGRSNAVRLLDKPHLAHFIFLFLKGIQDLYIRLFHHTLLATKSLSLAYVI